MHRANLGALRLASVALSTVVIASVASAQPLPSALTISNPNWNITLSDYGYSDLLLDNTPGFVGREYLSGEWAAAISYTRGGGARVAPTWLEPNFIFPDWTTNSNFNIVSNITPLAIDEFGNTTKAESVIANGDLRIKISYDMLDTVSGMKMGTSPASATTGSSIDSNRYILKQTYTVTNTSGDDITGLSLFQFLHALNGVTSLYDNRNYAGPQAGYQYDTTQVAVDTTFADVPTVRGRGGSGTTFKDYIGFSGAVAPVAVENGAFGTNTVDNHAVGKPSIGTHLSVEADALNNVDYFSPDPTNWVAGAQKYHLGLLPNNGSVSFDVLLGIRTGTVVSGTGGTSGSSNGGSSNPGGCDFNFEDVTEPGDFFCEYSLADADEVAEHVAEGDFSAPDFAYPGGLLQLYEIEFDGQFDGSVTLTLGYADSYLPAGFDEQLFLLHHFTDGAWTPLASIVDDNLNTLTVTVESLSPFAIGVVPEPAGMITLLAGTMLLCTRRTH